GPDLRFREIDHCWFAFIEMTLNLFNSSANRVPRLGSSPRPEDAHKQIASGQHLSIDNRLSSIRECWRSVCFPAYREQYCISLLGIQVIPVVDDFSDDSSFLV